MRTPRILSISNDPHLAWSRQLLLESRRFEVESFPSQTVLIECQGKSFDVAILGHTVSDNEKRMLVDELRRLYPSIKVIGLLQFGEVPDPAWDGTCSIDDGPTALLETVSSALSRVEDAAPCNKDHR
jgi:DNA-binding NtrC family response regulator